VAHDDRSDPQGAERSLDRFCETVGDARARRIGDLRTTVGELANAEVLATLPAPTRDHGGRTNRDRQCDGPLPGQSLQRSPGTGRLNARGPSATRGRYVRDPFSAGAVLATHRLAHDGAGVVVRDPAHAPRWSERCSVSSPRSDPATRRPTWGSATWPWSTRRRSWVRRGEASVSTSRTTRDWRRRERELHLPVAAKSPQRPAPRDRGRGAAGVLEEARVEKLGHTAMLERLSASRSRRRATSTREPREFASLPAPWRLSDFDFDAQPSVDRSLVNELGTLRF